MIKIPYSKGNPLAEFEISGKKGAKKLTGYLDTGATDLVIPKKIKDEVDLVWLGTTPVSTVGGIISADVYFGKVKFLGKVFEITIICRDLPDSECLIGRAIIDNFEICFNGKDNELIISNS